MCEKNYHTEIIKISDPDGQKQPSKPVNAEIQEFPEAQNRVEEEDNEEVNSAESNTRDTKEVESQGDPQVGNKGTPEETADALATNAAKSRETTTTTKSPPHKCQKSKKKNPTSSREEKAAAET